MVSGVPHGSLTMRAVSEVALFLGFQLLPSILKASRSESIPSQFRFSDPSLVLLSSVCPS